MKLSIGTPGGYGSGYGDYGDYGHYDGDAGDEQAWAGAWEQDRQEAALYTSHPVVVLQDESMRRTCDHCGVVLMHRDEPVEIEVEVSLAHDDGMAPYWTTLHLCLECADDHTEMVQSADGLPSVKGV